MLPPENLKDLSEISVESTWGAEEDAAEKLDAVLAQFGLEREEAFFKENCTKALIVGPPKKQKRLIDDKANDWLEESIWDQVCNPKRWRCVHYVRSLKIVL